MKRHRPYDWENDPEPVEVSEFWTRIMLFGVVVVAVIVVMVDKGLI